ncbi:prepilin peptidase [Yersinia intermedia]
MMDLYKSGCLLFSIFVGACIGGFLNVIIYRLPIMMADSLSKDTTRYGEGGVFKGKVTLLSPRSFCPACYCPLPAKYNIPILSWFYLRGQSQCCQQKINNRYLIVELMSTVLTSAIVYYIEDTHIIIASLFLIWALIVLSFIDIEYYILPDSITLPLLWCGLIFNINEGFSVLSSAVIGAIAGYLFLWFPYWLFKCFKGVEGMGRGDFKLMATLGAWFGITAIPLLVLLSALFGLLVYIVLYNILQKKVKYIAFGPCISLAGMTYLFLVV